MLQQVILPRLALGKHNHLLSKNIWLCKPFVILVYHGLTGLPSHSAKRVWLSAQKPCVAIGI
ncbi:Hypothetical protein HDN1F_19990 [gamma proteobacterium HdN1]|nr:Hypothetical protein HDN1F_19990 [gamma proteobacterium HdN1]